MRMRCSVDSPEYKLNARKINDWANRAHVAPGVPLASLHVVCVTVLDESGSTLEIERLRVQEIAGVQMIHAETFTDVVHVDEPFPVLALQATYN